MPKPKRARREGADVAGRWARARPNLFANPTLAMAQNSGPSLENELNTYRTIQKEIGKVQSQVGTAQTQILENEMVLKVRAITRALFHFSTLRRAITRALSHHLFVPLPRAHRSSTFLRRTPPSSS